MLLYNVCMKGHGWGTKHQFEMFIALQSQRMTTLLVSTFCNLLHLYNNKISNLKSEI
uniref:Uncharacterized protein n=1 Tax=Anguilla anguilla TaxID=7936 RepID=A0A0E9XET9_ANGAN